MKILVITTQFPSPNHKIRGSFNAHQLGSLNVNHEVTVISPIPWTEELKDRFVPHSSFQSGIIESNIQVYHPRYLFTPKLWRSHYGAFYEYSVRSLFERIVRYNRPDVVLGCFAHPDGWAAVRLAHRRSLPAVIKCHGSDVLVLKRTPRRLKLAEGLTMADGVVTVSQDLAHHTIALGADPTKVSVVPHGIDHNRFRPVDRAAARSRLGLAAEVPIILFVGNLLRSKGAAALVEACGVLAARSINFTCVLIGRGRDEAVVRATVSRLGLSERVSLVGSRLQAELPDWYAACNVVALPSFSEGIPNVLREARACGRPFVATRVGGIPEIAEPGSSLLVEPGDLGALADALEEALANRLDGSAGKPTMSWAESAERLHDVLLAAIARHSQRHPGGGRTARYGETLIHE